jgi:hypothetical protein
MEKGQGEGEERRYQVEGEGIPPTLTKLKERRCSNFVLGFLRIEFNIF